MSFVDSGAGVDAASGVARDLSDTLDAIQRKTDRLTVDVSSFARAMTGAFTQAARGGKQFDDVLRSLALKLSELAVRGALGSAAGGLSGGLGDIFGGTAGKSSPAILNAMGAIKPFAAGGVIGAPTYFPVSGGGLGLAGEAGPEAILPLSRGRDGRLGIASNGAGGLPQVTVNIATPDVDSFRRSEAWVTGQIARAVARGQRSL